MIIPIIFIDVKNCGNVIYSQFITVCSFLYCSRIYIVIILVLEAIFTPGITLVNENVLFEEIGEKFKIRKKLDIMLLEKNGY